MITLDTSALVALLLESDPHHEAMVARLRDERPPFLVPEPVLAELDYLLSRRVGPHAIVPFFADAVAGYWKLMPIAPYLQRVAELVVRYADLPLGVTDAGVVALAEAHGGRVLTKDRHLYVLSKEGSIEVVA